MVYGKQVLLPIEFQISTYRLVAELGMDRQTTMDDDAQQQRMMQLNELDEVRQDSL